MWSEHAWKPAYRLVPQPVGKMRSRAQQETNRYGGENSTPRRTTSTGPRTADSLPLSMLAQNGMGAARPAVSYRTAIYADSTARWSCQSSSVYQGVVVGVGAGQGVGSVSSRVKVESIRPFLVDHPAHIRYLAAATNLQLFPNAFRHLLAMGTRDIRKLTSGTTDARLQHTARAVN